MKQHCEMTKKKILRLCKYNAVIKCVESDPLRFYGGK